MDEKFMSRYNKLSVTSGLFTCVYFIYLRFFFEMSTRRARGSGPKRGPNLTKNAYIFWNDCPVPCGDVVNYRKILDDTAHLKKGDTVAVTLAKERVKQGTVLELGKLLHVIFL